MPAQALDRNGKSAVRTETFLREEDNEQHSRHLRTTKNLFRLVETGRCLCLARFYVHQQVMERIVECSESVRMVGWEHIERIFM
jgi:hypothetical protein